MMTTSLTAALRDALKEPIRSPAEVFAEVLRLDKTRNSAVSSSSSKGKEEKDDVLRLCLLVRILRAVAMPPAPTPSRVNNACLKRCIRVARSCALSTTSLLSHRDRRLLTAALACANLRVLGAFSSGNERRRRLHCFRKLRAALAL